MNDSIASRRVFFLFFVFGVMSLLGMLDRPSLASIRAVDVVHLIATGMLFGGALVSLGASRRADRH